MPEHERVAGKARVNVPGSSAEPIGDDVGDRGSLLVSVGEFTELARRPARSTDTNDLSARLWSDRRCGELGRVLNLCEGGMLLESSSDPEVAEGVGFELVGPGFRYAGEQGMLIDGLALAPVGARISFGLADRDISHIGCDRVAHWTESSAGVAVDHWHGALEAIRGLVAGESEPAGGSWMPTSPTGGERL